MIGDQVGKETEEADGRVVGDNFERLHDAVRDVLEQLRRSGLRAARHLHAEAEEHRRHDQRQDGPAAEQLRKVGLREEVDDHVGHAERTADLPFDHRVFARNRRDDQNGHIHDDRRNGRRGEKTSRS